LESQGFRIQRIDMQAQDTGFDLLARRADAVWAVEVKYYRTRREQASLLEAAARGLLTSSLKAGVRKAMLVVSCSLSLPLRAAIQERYGLTIHDRADLTEWAAKAPPLLDELEALLEIESPAPIDGQSRPKAPTAEEKDLPNEAPPEDHLGMNLCQRLRALKSGRSTWAAYERLCAEILRYLFPRDLLGWRKQQRTDDDLNRFDYVCRIKPTTDFWRFLIDHLNSRYVLFEFKNYAGQIKQGQILTTEKYLLERGLRRVAIIVTRKGAHRSAVSMVQGAMRENGKLMLVLDDHNLCKMLYMRQRGEDPSDLLFDLTDEFLLALPR